MEEQFEWTHLRDVLIEFGQVLAQELRDEMTMENAIATGRLYGSVHYVYDRNGSEYSVSIGLEDYYKYILKDGRGPGKMPPIDAIRQWIQVKHIVPRMRNGNLPSVSQLAFLIARKIGREGYTGTNIWESSLNSTLDEFEYRIAEAIDKDLDDSLNTMFLKLKSV